MWPIYVVFSGQEQYDNIFISRDKQHAYEVRKGAYTNLVMITDEQERQMGREFVDHECNDTDCYTVECNSLEFIEERWQHRPGIIRNIKQWLLGDTDV